MHEWWWGSTTEKQLAGTLKKGSLSNPKPNFVYIYTASSLSAELHRYKRQNLALTFPIEVKEVILNQGAEALWGAMTSFQGSCGVPQNIRCANTYT